MGEKSALNCRLPILMSTLKWKSYKYSQRSHSVSLSYKNIICIADIMKTFLTHILQCSLRNVERLVLEKKSHFSFDKVSYLVPGELSYKLHIFKSPSSSLPNGQISTYVGGTDPTCSKLCPVFLFLQQISLRGIYCTQTMLELSGWSFL